MPVIVWVLGGLAAWRAGDVAGEEVKELWPYIAGAVALAYFLGRR